MDVRIKKCCPNCSQMYFIKSSIQTKVNNLPLFLACGHTMCESCVTNILKFEEPIECKICHNDMQLKPSEVAAITAKKILLYDFFPVNFSLLGELTLQTIEQQHLEPNDKKDDDFFVDIQGIIKSTENTQGQCMECHTKTSKMCQECQMILCDTCFNKSHKNFVIFKNHVLKNIEQSTVSNTCKTHKGKPLDYYCQDCKKSLCMDCLMVGGDKSCKNHNVVTFSEVNDNFLEEVNDITPKVDETYRRLTKTAVDVGHLLFNIENETGTSSELNQMLSSVKQHFSKLYAAIQKHEKEVLDIIIKLKCSEKESLHKAKADLTTSIKKAKTVLNTINATSNRNKAKQFNLSVLLEEAKQIVDTPWFLSREQSTDPLKVVVNEDLCALVSDYVHLEGNASSTYKLRATSQLEGTELPPPPPAPVFPPELPKDVRKSVRAGSDKGSSKGQPPAFCKNAPTYRSKSGSASSLNSLHSDHSFDKAFTGGSDIYQNFQRPVVQPVQPFAESQHPKQLHEGAQELIYMTHLVDPHNFFVQRACHQTLVKEMLREFRHANSLPRPSLNHVAEGKIYLVYNKADNMWQRCRIVSINRKDPSNPSFLVFCVDFGSTETVHIEKLRLLPPARVQSPYPLAINCSLANCEPKTGAWTSDDALLIQKIIDNKQAILYVRHIRSTNNYSVKLECDVTTFEDGVNIARALVFHERARMPNAKLRYPNIIGVMEKPKIFMSNGDLKPKSVEEVHITHIISPDKFFVRKKHLNQVYEKLSEDLEQEYGMTNSGSVYLPEIGMSYVVKTEKCMEVTEGARWARGVVTELPGRGRVRLTLVDCGAPVLLHWTTLRHMRPKFTTQRALATECHLAGVTPLNKKWSGASVALLQRFADRPLELHVEDARRGSVGVTLYDRSDEDNVVCVNTEMIKHKFAVTFGLFMFNNNEVADQVYTNKSPLDEPKQHAKDPNQKQIVKKPQAPIKINEKELDAKDKGPIRLEAKVLHYQSPSLLYVSLVHQQKTFNELYDGIQKYYSKKQGKGKENWEVGDRCCTFCAQSQTWRRAAIVEIDANNAKVFYSDFACIESVPVANLRELTPEFMAIGDAAIKCHLSGIVPADGSEEWPTITQEYLKELLDAYPRVFITRLGNFKNKSMPVEVWVYHTIQGGALEPNKSEWRCLNKKIIEQGLGIPDKSQPQCSKEAEPTKDDMLSFLKNVTGSVDEYLQLEPLPTRPMALPPRGEPSPELDENVEGATKEDNTVFITDWLPPEPLQCKEFTAVPTYIDNEGVIYLHDVAQQDTLELIRKALDVRFTAPDPKAKYAKWSVGEPCVALFFMDNRFYRGRVVEVCPESNSCLIQYVDYGNEEQCSFENLRKSIALYQIPVQAHRCVLANIRPVGARWDRQTLDYIHKSIVEKHCFVRVTGEPIADVLPIQLKYDKLWINDHLVDFEMAVYADGSKAVVRKYKSPPSLPSPAYPASPPPAEPDSSGPDYIVEDDSEPSLTGKDWNEIIEEEENKSIKGTFLTYPPYDDEEFRCNICFINDPNILDLSLVLDDDAAPLYEQLLEEVREGGGACEPLDGVYENKACVALYPEDEQWYRAAILQYSEARGQIKVRYVDYGNTAVVDIGDVREIPEEWAQMSGACVRARLHGVAPAPLPAADLARRLADSFLLRGPFHGKVIEVGTDSIPAVELRDDDDQLVYESLIQDGILVKI